MVRLIADKKVEILNKGDQHEQGIFPLRIPR